MVTVGYEKHLVFRLSYWLIHISWCEARHGLPWCEFLSFRSLRFMAVLLGALLSVGAAKTRANERIALALNQSRHSTQAILFVDGSCDSVCYVLL